MVYTDIAILAFLFSVVFDLFIVKARLLRRAVFWTSYAIILPFQLITNWWLTSRNIVMYSPEAIVGTRIASAPVEDLLFGFALILSVLNMWIFWGRKGVQKINYFAIIDRK
jgi:lycopene cyclase domain-containing protein